MRQSIFFICLRRSLLLGFCSLGLAQLVHAQGGTPGNTGPSPQSPTAVPLDGGTGLLLAAGVGFGLKKLRQRRLLPS